MKTCLRFSRDLWRYINSFGSDWTAYMSSVESGGWDGETAEDRGTTVTERQHSWSERRPRQRVTQSSHSLYRSTWWISIPSQHVREVLHQPRAGQLFFHYSHSDSVYWTCSQKAKNKKVKQTIMHCTTKQYNTRQKMILCNIVHWARNKKIRKNS